MSVPNGHAVTGESDSIAVRPLVVQVGKVRVRNFFFWIVCAVSSQSAASPLVLRPVY